MATLNLTKVWIHVLTSGEGLGANSSNGRSSGHSVDGAVRTYAGGRQRAISTQGTRGTFSFTLVLLSLAQIETLKSWIGQGVVVRDHRGQRFFGVYFVVGVGEYKDPAIYTAQIELLRVSHDEGV